MVSQGDSRSRSRLPFFRSFLVFGGGLLAALIMCNAPAFAVHNTGVFELDGNAAAPSSADDFNTIYSGPGLSFDHAFVNDSSLPDASFHGGTNLDTQPISAWRCITKDNPTPINDLRHAYAAAYMINGDLHLFFGGDRGGNGGNSWFGLWLFQKPVQCNSVTGVFSGQKTDGDLFITSHLNVTGENFEIHVYRWTDPTVGAPESGDEFLTELGTGGEDCTGSDPHAASEHVCGVLNTGSISVAWEGAPLPERRYLEGGLNLSALFQEHAFGPLCYSTFMAETRGGLPLGARPFDYAFGDLSTCASVTVDATTDPSNDPQQFDFALAGGPDAINDTFQLADTTLPHTTFDLKPGSYMVTETVPGLWDLTNANCVGGPFGGGGAYPNGGVFSLNFGDHVTCNFLNVKKRGRITVDKATTPSGDPQLFNFTVTGGPDAVNDVFQLADATVPHTTMSLRPGAYSITEAAQAGWDIGNISCSGGQFGLGGAYANGGTINLDWGDLVTCTFSNTKRGSIAVDKETAPVGDPRMFDFLVAGGPDSLHDVFQLTDAAAPHTTTNLRPGTYSLTETVPAGWDFGSAACVGGSFGAGGSLTNGGTFTLTPGAQIICTVTNIRRSRITVDVVTTPSGDPQLFKFTLKGKPTAGGKAIRATFQLADATTPFTIEVQPGWFKLVQKKVKGWTLANITCVGGPFGAGNPYDNKSKFTLLPTDIVTCTYRNTKP